MRPRGGPSLSVRSSVNSMNVTTARPPPKNLERLTPRPPTSGVPEGATRSPRASKTSMTWSPLRTHSPPTPEESRARCGEWVARLAESHASESSRPVKVCNHDGLGTRQLPSSQPGLYWAGNAYEPEGKRREGQGTNAGHRLTGSDISFLDHKLRYNRGSGGRNTVDARPWNGYRNLLPQVSIR